MAEKMNNTMKKILTGMMISASMACAMPFNATAQNRKSNQEKQELRDAMARLAIHDRELAATQQYWKNIEKRDSLLNAAHRHLDQAAVILNQIPETIANIDAQKNISDSERHILMSAAASSQAYAKTLMDIAAHDAQMADSLNNVIKIARENMR